MQTIAYIDGYNLFYGCLKGTPYKWLDVVKLCQRLLKEHNSEATLIQVKYFTAIVKGSLSKRKELSPQSQQKYHRALKALYPEPFLEIIESSYSLERSFFHPYEKPIPLDTKVAVWRPEEKQTDVKIALHIYRDVAQSSCNSIMLFSNDSDLAPALEFSRQSHPSIELGVIFPRKEDNERPPNASLAEHADWSRLVIRDEELHSSLMNDMVPTSKKPAIKPEHW